MSSTCIDSRSPAGPAYAATRSGGLTRTPTVTERQGVDSSPEAGQRGDAVASLHGRRSATLVPKCQGSRDMRLRRFKTHNFKPIEYTSIEWDDLLVLIGENNCGKSSERSAGNRPTSLSSS